MSAYDLRLKDLDQVLDSDKIDLNRLRDICFNGIPDEKGYRAMCWRLLLNYLPLDKNKWDEHLNHHRNLYQQWLDEILVTPGSIDDEQSDHPLNDEPNSKWNTFFKDNQALTQIDKDVRRLHPELSFFQQATEYPQVNVVNSNGTKRLNRRVGMHFLNSANVERKGLGIVKISARPEPKNTSEFKPLEEGSEAHWEVVERILFVYCKLNPGQGYVQGMNEIIGPIYYCFATDPIVKMKKHAEADCFFVFTNLMSEIRDFFIKTLDEADSGIVSMMHKVTKKLKENDPVLHSYLINNEIHPQYYSFRWLTLMLSQEFSLPEVLRIWDSLFSDAQRFSFLIHICCAMIILIKDQILEGDFPTIVKLLQNYPNVEMSVILNKAAELNSR
ncbi:TBC1 domain family member 13 [Adelges cooleyi]|uniref:TBC1 domain family member 13 n=1 Tax=Adelges cooleyi TaxID=133065 RepID=UPI0021804F24|nr:TBC1 domain family member 13 [Adelges cooleyi]XP_050431941.1 TBC1 domain family member 13 [Adelges cooleyi]